MATNRKNDPFSLPSSPFSTQKEEPVSEPTNTTPTPSAPVFPGAPVPTPIAKPVAQGSIPTPTVAPVLPKPEFKPPRGAANELFPAFPTATPNYTSEEDLEVPEEDEEEVDLLADYSEEEISLAERQVDSSTIPSALPTLYALAEDEDWVVRMNVAANPSTPASLLERLAKDTNSYVRQEVMDNSLCPDHVYRHFAFDTDDDLIYDWIENPRTTADMLTPLFVTGNVFIASGLVDSALVPESVKTTLRQKFKL